MTDVGLKALLEQSRFGPKARQLSLSGIRFTERATQQLGQRLPKMRQLELAGCGGISDNVVGQIGRGCKDLEKLDVTACESLSNSCIGSLTNSAKALRIFSLAACRGLNNEP